MDAGFAVWKVERNTMQLYNAEGAGLTCTISSKCIVTYAGGSSTPPGKMLPQCCCF